MNNRFSLKKLVPLISLFCSPAFAGELLVTPSIDFSFISTDNVDALSVEKESAFLSQITPSLLFDYDAAHSNFKIKISDTSLFYSHDNSENDSYFSLESEGAVDLNASGLKAIVFSDIFQRSRSNTQAALVDLVNDDTITMEEYQAGFEYNKMASSFLLNSRLLGEITRAEDGFDERNGINFTLNGKNNNNENNVLWRANSNYDDYVSEEESSRFYKNELIFGWISGANINPYIRIYNEDTAGTITASDVQKINSVGFGLNVYFNPSLNIFFSYNDASKSSSVDNYYDAKLTWKPSIYTNLDLSYGQRFFGDTYNVDFNHKYNGFSNSFSYNENLSAFDRYSFDTESLGFYWCPIGNEDEFSQCTSPGSSEMNNEIYSLVEFSQQVPVQSKEYVLNRSGNWTSTYQLYRTEIKLFVDYNKRTHLSTSVEDIVRYSGVDIKRDTSELSNVTIGGSYRESLYGVNKPSDELQFDKYLIGYIKYERDLNSTLTSSLELKYINRESNFKQHTYDEARLTLSFNKEF